MTWASNSLNCMAGWAMRSCGSPGSTPSPPCTTTSCSRTACCARCCRGVSRRQQPLHQRVLDAALGRDQEEVLDQLGRIAQQGKAAVLDQVLVRPAGRREG